MNVMSAIGRVRLARAPSTEEDTEQLRVLQLFRNRAELKKAYSELQDEIHRLKDRLKQQEGATVRVQEMLAQLEERLGTTETAYPAMVFYQLRRLWGAGADILRAFGKDLESQHVERERRAYLAEVNRREFARRQQAEAALRAAEAVVGETAQHLQQLNRELAAARRPWHYFRRKELAERIALGRATLAQAESNLAEARGAHEAAAAAGGDAFPGLSVDARRTVNVAIIAYAEALAARLALTPLLAQARAAVLRREPTDEYGGRAECEAQMVAIAAARETLQQRANLGQELRTRVERLQRCVAYRTDADAIPLPDSLGLAPRERDPLLQGPAVEGKPQPNVLAEDTWDLTRVLLA